MLALTRYIKDVKCPMGPPMFCFIIAAGTDAFQCRPPKGGGVKALVNMDEITVPAS